MAIGRGGDTTGEEKGGNLENRGDRQRGFLLGINVFKRLHSYKKKEKGIIMRSYYVQEKRVYLK